MVDEDTQNNSADFQTVSRAPTPIIMRAASPTVWRAGQSTTSTAVQPKTERTSPSATPPTSKSEYSSIGTVDIQSESVAPGEVSLMYDQNSEPQAFWLGFQNIITILTPDKIVLAIVTVMIFILGLTIYVHSLFKP